MIEILWHGRGGQGAFTAARLLGAAASMSDGVYALAFPSFGPERRGAPMRAFTKVSTRPIGDRSAISQADFVIYLDDTLLSHNWDDELKLGGCALVNSAKEYGDPRIIAIDANGISEKILGRPIPNTVFLGALSVLCEIVSPDDVVSAIRQYMPAKLHEKNERIVAHTRRLLLARVTGVSSACDAAESGAAAGTAAAGSASAGTAADGTAAAAEAASVAGVSRSPDVVRTCAHIPRLRSQFSSAPSLDPAVFARTTCYAAGHLVAKNAGWRNMRPVVDASACTGCLQCYLYCPDGAIFKTKEDAIASRGAKGAASGANVREVASHAADAGIVANINAAVHASGIGSASAAVEIDYDFCKGCGVCVKACRFDAIRMVPENAGNVSRETFPAAAAASDDAAVPTDVPASPNAAASPNVSVGSSGADDPVGGTGVSGAAAAICNVDANTCDLAGGFGGDRAVATAAAAPASPNAAAVSAPSLASAAPATESEVSAR